MKALFGKQIFLWNVPAVAGGEPEKIADLLALGGFSEVWVKAANGAYPHYPNRLRWPLWGANVNPEFVQVMHSRKFRVVGWGFCYGADFLGEADIAIKQVQSLGLDGWGFDAEAKFETYSDCGARAYKMTNRARQALPDTPLAFISWAYWKSPTLGGTWHNHEMAREAMRFCDVGVPMMYWPGSTSSSALYQLDHSTKQWTDLVTDKPIVPAGRAYDGDGGTASPVAIADFGNAAHELGYPGCNWWSFDIAHARADLWGALVATPGFGKPEPAPKPESTGMVLRVTNDPYVNKRSGPGIGYPDVGDYPKGTEITATDIGGEDVWIKDSEGNWAAVRTGGKTYMVRVD